MGFKGRLGRAGGQVYREIREWAQNAYPSALGVVRTGGDGARLVAFWTLSLRSFCHLCPMTLSPCLPQL